MATVISSTPSKYAGKTVQTLSDGTKVRVKTGTNKSGSGSDRAINTASQSSLASERFDLDTKPTQPVAPVAPVTPPTPYSATTPTAFNSGTPQNVTTGGINYQFDQSGKLIAQNQSTPKTPSIPSVDSLRTPVTSADSLTGFITEMERANKAAQREYLKSLEPTRSEDKIQKRINDILNSTEQGLVDAEGRVVSLGAIVGEQQLIEKRSQTLLAPLQRELNRLISSREAKSQGLATALSFQEKNQNLQLQVLKEIQAPILEAQKETRSFARNLLTKYPDIAPYVDINSMSAEDIAGIVSSKSKIFQLEQDADEADIAYKYAQINNKGTGRPATGLEKTNLGFYNRGYQAIEDAKKVEDQISKLGLRGQTRLEYAPNFLQTPEGQLYNQAQKTFTEARLRKESGAAIPPSEFKNDRLTYFVQPGDTPTTIRQKKLAREQVLEGLKFASGNAYEEFYGYPPEYGPATENTEVVDTPKTINTPDGKKWKINSDGSYTEI